MNIFALSNYSIMIRQCAVWGVFFMLFFIGMGCKNEDPSVVKINVRSGSDTIITGAEVRIIGDLSKDTPEYQDQTISNGEGVALFNIDPIFDKYGKDDQLVANFTVYARDSQPGYTITKVRAKAHLTTTETIILKK